MHEGMGDISILEQMILLKLSMKAVLGVLLIRISYRNSNDLRGIERIAQFDLGITFMNWRLYYNLLDKFNI